MKTMLNAFYTKPLAVYLAVALIAISTFAGPAQAMFLPAQPGTGTAAPELDRPADMAKIQATLESKAVQQRLMDYGLSAEQVTAKLGGLSDEQIHQLAANMDSLQAGGDAISALVVVLLIALLVVLLIYLLEGKIEVRRR